YKRRAGETMTQYTPQQAHDNITALFDDYYDAKKADVHAVSIPPNKRIENADAIVEQYVEANGKRPPSSVLSRLATYLLLDTLADTHPDKMARDEYPVMSYWQTGRYFARNRPIAPEQYTQESVMGRKSSAKEWGSDNSDALLFADDPMLLDVIESVDLEALLDNAKLTNRQRQAIDLVYFEDMTQEQAAEVMGVTRQAVDLYARNAINKLRRLSNE